MQMRFIVEQTAGGSAWMIADVQHEMWKLPREAVTLRFGDRNKADDVAGILNAEWVAFLCNPQ